jgi:hypothetical protein
MFRTADFKNQWAKWLFDPKKTMSWDVKTFEDYLNTFMTVNSQYGHAIENFRIVVKPVRWYIDNETTGKRDYYADLSEMVFLEGVEDWDALVKLGAGYEILEDEEPRELTLDELADEL